MFNTVPGTPLINGFKSKADALKYAIDKTTSYTTSPYECVPNYKKAQKLFDFICDNVTLPDVEESQSADLLDFVKTTLQTHLNNDVEPKAVHDPYLTIYAKAKELGYKNVQGTGSNDGCSDTLQLRKDDYEYTIEIERRKITF